MRRTRKRRRRYAREHRQGLGRLGLRHRDAEAVASLSIPPCQLGALMPAARSRTEHVGPASTLPCNPARRQPHLGRTRLRESEGPPTGALSWPRSSAVWRQAPRSVGEDVGQAGTEHRHWRADRDGARPERPPSSRSRRPARRLSPLSSVVRCQPEPSLLNTYAAPVSSWLSALTTIVVPVVANAAPKKSPAWLSGPRSLPALPPSRGVAGVQVSRSTTQHGRADHHQGARGGDGSPKPRASPQALGVKRNQDRHHPSGFACTRGVRRRARNDQNGDRAARHPVGPHLSRQAGSCPGQRLHSGEQRARRNQPFSH